MTLPATSRILDIAFYTQGSEFNGNSVSTKGLGGSESALLYVARELARLGHRVTVFCNCDEPGVYDAVDYRSNGEFLSFCRHHRQDVCVFSRFYEPLPQANAAAKILWLHDIAGIQYYKTALPVIDTYVDRYFLISEWQKQGFIDNYDIDSDKLFLTRNGVDLKLFENSPQRNPDKLIYINTPFRGLDVLVRLFPRIRERAPTVELHVYAGMSLYGDQFMDVEERLRGLYEEARSQPGIFLHPPVPKAELAQQLMSSWLSVYPSHFAECCSIASLESQAAGTPMVTSELAGLKDTIINGQTGILLPVDDAEQLSHSPDYQQRFVDCVANLIEDRKEWEQLSRSAKDHIRDNYTWPQIAREWEREFFAVLDKQSEKPPRPCASERELQQVASRFFQRGAIKPALDIYKQLCELHPTEAQNWHMRSAISGMLGDFSDTVQACEKALALVPGAGAVHSNYANALMELGRYPESQAAFEQAIRFNPNDPGTRINMGKLHRRIGNIDDAIQCFSNALRIMPTATEAMDEIGQTHFSAGNYNAALDWYRKAVDARPDSAVYRNNLGTAHQHLGQDAEAENCFLESIRLNPDQLIAYCNLAYLYSTQGDYDKSLEYYEHALRKQADYEPALAGKAVILERLGEFQAAFDLVKPVIDSGTYADQTALAYARLSPRLGSDSHAITVLEALLGKPSLSMHDRIQANYALGKLLDHSGNFDDAFSRFRKANELCNVTFNRTAHQQLVEAVMRAFDRETVKLLPASSNADNGMIFVVGMPRSGTTLVEQILASHPRVFGAGELTDIRDIAAGLPAETGSRHCFPLEFNRVTQEILDKFSFAHTAKLREMANGEDIIIDKMPSNFMFLGLIERLFPNAKIIHCKRDPMDTCLSCYIQHFSTGQFFSHDQSDLAFFYNSYRRLMEHWQSTLQLPILEVQYEELIRDQENVTRRMVAFAGLDWNPDCLDFHKSRRKVVTASYAQVRNPIYSSSVGKWKKYRKHLSILERDLAKQDL